MIAICTVVCLSSFGALYFGTGLFIIQKIKFQSKILIRPTGCCQYTVITEADTSNARHPNQYSGEWANCCQNW